MRAKTASLPPEACRAIRFVAKVAQSTSGQQKTAVDLRDTRAIEARYKIAEAMMIAWRRGDHEAVKSSIECTLDEDMRRQWKDDIIELLPAPERQGFLDYMQGNHASV